MPRFVLGPLLLALCTACAASNGPGPQEATFPPGQRVARGDDIGLELAGARYDLRQVSLQVEVSNRGDEPIVLEREGMLLAYGELEFPASAGGEDPVAAQTAVEPGASVQLRLEFVTEQAMVEAGTLQLLSIRRGDDWEEPLRLVVPPPAAFVDAVGQAPVEE